MFSKNSTRTRNSFEVGVYQLGGRATHERGHRAAQSGRGEPLRTPPGCWAAIMTALSSAHFDRQCDLEEFAVLAGVPVINGLTDYCHPCQVLADLMTIRE